MTGRVIDGLEAEITAGMLQKLVWHCARRAEAAIELAGAAMRALAKLEAKRSLCVVKLCDQLRGGAQGGIVNGTSTMRSGRRK